MSRLSCGFLGLRNRVDRQSNFSGCHGAEILDSEEDHASLTIGLQVNCDEWSELLFSHPSLFSQAAQRGIEDVSNRDQHGVSCFGL